ncbi:ParB/RepB/Spo0J family partition protein [Candidatus Parcubacteria bacterium]|nr:ParB/RepB/Spo0J family partition protein [Candidatus Parcubacteria bacterium]
MTNGLGRGLGSLIPNKKNQSAANFVAGVKAGANIENNTLELDIDDIKVNSLQPRKKFSDIDMDELVESIKEYGVIQPLIVAKKKIGDKYELIAGERRLRASKLSGLKKVPVIFRDVNEQQKLEVALIENIQRENLSPIDLAEAYQKLADEFNLTQEEIAKKMGKSRPSITNTLRMLKLPGEIQIALIDDKITEGHAKYLIGLDTEVKQMTLFRKILHNNLSVSDTNNEIKKIGGTKKARLKINYADKDKEFAFREFFGAKVEVKRKGKGGQIIIEFFSDDELGELTAKVK